MRHPVHFHQDARRELGEARDYYRDIDPSLATRFIAETDVSIRYIAGFPEAGAPLFDQYRHVVLPHFPYMLVYEIRGETIGVLAVLHVRRDPDWMKQQLAGRPPTAE